MHHASLLDHFGGQLDRLCRVVGVDLGTPVELLSGILGPYRDRPLSLPPAWPSDIADDHSPVEFSIAFNDAEPPILRILAETPGTRPDTLRNMSAGYAFLAGQAARQGLSTHRLDSVRDLFDVDDPQGAFGLWCSVVFHSGRAPEFKVYYNPEVAGADRAPLLVGEALRRLGLGDSYRAMLTHAVRPGQLGRADRLAFFALDLHDGPQSRVKLYLSHHDAEAADVARAAAIVDDVDPAEVAAFCTAAGGPGVFGGRPLIGSYTLTEAADKPVGYSVYVPIRDYVTDDAEALDRTAALLDRYGFDPALLDRAVAAVTSRAPADGVGLIAHVSLRLGRPRPGVTVYLSSEAYEIRRAEGGEIRRQAA
jgi:DMATS type aromatic prenyltransferase